jgi:hypothetical protein
MRQEVESNAIRPSFEQSASRLLANEPDDEDWGQEGRGGGQTWHLDVRVMVCSRVPTILMSIFLKRL